MTTDWHASAATLNQFALDPAGLDPATAASIEAHLVACDSCRRALADLSDPATTARSWDALADRIDRPRPHAVERLLVRLGVKEDTARLVSATPALSVAWLAAMIVVTAAVSSASRVTDADGPYLLLAPIAPLAAVAVTFASVTDPAGEAGVPTPMNGVSLLLRRAAVVLVPVFFVLGTFAFLLPDFDGAVAWVLPSMSLTLVSLASSTWWRPERTTAVLGLGWLAIVSVVRRVQGETMAFADSVVFSPAGQLTCLAAGVAAGLLLARRHDHLTTLEVRR